MPTGAKGGAARQVRAETRAMRAIQQKNLLGRLLMGRLNMWQRLGVAASVLWVVVSVIRDYYIYKRLYSTALDLAFRACEVETGFSDVGCYVRGLIDFREPSIFRLQFLLNALVPVACGWSLAYLLIWIARWILAGRKISN